MGIRAQVLARCEAVRLCKNVVYWWLFVGTTALMTIDRALNVPVKFRPQGIQSSGNTSEVPEYRT